MKPDKVLGFGTITIGKNPERIMDKGIGGPTINMARSIENIEEMEQR